MSWQERPDFDMGRRVVVADRRDGSGRRGLPAAPFLATPAAPPDIEATNWQQRPDIYPVPPADGWRFRRAQERNLATSLGTLAMGLIFVFAVAVPLLATGFGWLLTGE